MKFSFEYFTKNPPVWDELSINGKSIIQNIEVLNDYTLKITVDNPNATILGRWAMPGSSPSISGRK